MTQTMNDEHHESAMDAVQVAMSAPPEPVAETETESLGIPAAMTPQQIAMMASEAMKDCERAATSLESLGTAALSIANSLMTQCSGTARMIRERGSETSRGVQTFADLAAEQAEEARRLAERTEAILPRRVPNQFAGNRSLVAMRQEEHQDLSEQTDTSKLSFLRRNKGR